MAEKLLKGTLLVALMLVMAIGAPAMTRAEVGANAGSSDPGSIISDATDLNSAMGMLPGLFGGMGGAGQVLGQIMSLLVDQFMELSARELIPGYYVLNATVEKTWNTTIAQGTQVRNFYPDYGYYNASQSQDALDAAYGIDNYGYPYCTVNRTIVAGGINVTKTTGMSITIGIWDADGTLVKAIDRVMKTVQKFMKMSGTDAGYKAALEDAASSVMYLIIHINDIITGDELIIYNPITYEYVRTNGTFSETHDWWIYNSTGGNWKRQNMTEHSPALLAGWKTYAESYGNEFMAWLLGPGIGQQYYDNTWGSFSFDLMQLWLKRFYVSIDVQELVNMINSKTGNVNPAKILKDLDIDFYLLWHHLMGGIFYNDTMPGPGYDNGKIDVIYQNVTTPENITIQRPVSTEVTHLIGMKRMDSVTWNQPTANTDKTAVSWGVRFNGMNIFWTPVGMNAEDRVRNAPTTNATLEFLELGFTFEPGAIIQLNNTDGTPSDKQGRDAKVKLNQHFGRWNVQPRIQDPNLDGLDFAMLYLSTLVHVHFTASLLEKIAKGTGDWNEGNKQATVNSTKVEEKHELVFGSEAGPKSPMVGRVDIAGPGYDIYEYAAPSTTSVRRPASTQIIPLALFTMDAQATGSYEDSSGGFDAAAYLGIEFAVMLYSVNYPEFSNPTYNGGKIWHDPTFSIFMTFEAGTYWAIFLLVGVVALVGIAAILITRSKNNR